jgi:N-methylhydantoinase B
VTAIGAVPPEEIAIVNHVDPVDQAVISQALIAAAREMGAKLVRSAYSPVVREASDCAAALLDRHGNVVAQAELIPMQLGPIGTTFRPCAERYPVDELVEGDFYINNHPFEGGQHVPDVFLFTPIFYERQVVAFGATVAHHLDLGGGAPGLNPEARDVYQEGILFPPGKWNMKRDWNGGPFERLVRANVRVPEQTLGDFNAQFAANGIGVRRVQELCARYGAKTVTAAMAELLDYSERRLRAAIAAVPDGVYQGEAVLDDDGLGGEPLAVRATVTIAGDQVHVDFAGTAPQAPTNINCPFASTIAAALSCVKSVLTSPDIPFNEGSKRPIVVTAPYGSLVNPRPPAPVRARMLSGYRVFNAVMSALARVVPERVIAEGFDTTEVVCLSHLGHDGYRIYLEIFGGGYGASAQGDGCDAVDSPLSNCGNIPVESMDLDYDFFRVLEYSVRPGSGGAGRHRGGMGFCRRYLITRDQVTLATYGDRFVFAPPGLFGGQPGARAASHVVRNGKRIVIGSKQSFALAKGDVLVMLTGGGAGYGDPAERPRPLIARELDEGLIAPGAARRLYRFVPPPPAGRGPRAASRPQQPGPAGHRRLHTT